MGKETTDTLPATNRHRTREAETALMMCRLAHASKVKKAERVSGGGKYAKGGGGVEGRVAEENVLQLV